MAKGYEELPMAGRLLWGPQPDPLVLQCPGSVCFCILYGRRCPPSPGHQGALPTAAVEQISKHNPLCKPWGELPWRVSPVLALRSDRAHSDRAFWTGALCEDQ